MGRWMDRFMDGCVHTCIGWMGACMHASMCGWMDRLMCGWMDRWNNGCMDVCMHGTDACMSVWMDE